MVNTETLQSDGRQYDSAYAGFPVTKEMIDSFVVELHFKGLLPRTVREYKNYILMFYNDFYLEDEKSDKIPKDSLLEHSLVMFLGRRKTPIKRAVMGLFFRQIRKAYYWDEFCLTHEHDMRIKKRQKLKRRLTMDDVVKVFHAMPTRKWKLMFLTHFETGARVDEIVRLTKNSIPEGIDAVHFTVKGGRSKTVYISKSLAEELRDLFYLQDIDYPFTYKKSVLYTYKKYNELLKQLSEEIVGFPITTHAIRRSRGVDIYTKTGKDLVATQKFLGHRKPETTLIYIEDAGISSMEFKKAEGDMLAAIDKTKKDAEEEEEEQDSGNDVGKDGVVKDEATAV